MGLKSKHFQGEPRLEACLVNDASHVMPNQRGPFVFKIQQALAILDGAKIPDGELYPGFYGPVTTAAVLKYKQGRKIINQSYQSSADNIVGKMMQRERHPGHMPFVSMVTVVTNVEGSLN